MVSSGRHPKNPIAQAIQVLDADLFDVNEIHKGHRWGAVVCKVCGDDQPIWSSPRVPEDNASDIAKFARRHTKKH